MYYRRVVCLSVAGSGRGQHSDDVVGGRRRTLTSRLDVDAFCLIYARLTLTLSGRNTRLLAIL